jgi:hypothetical protein
MVVLTLITFLLLLPTVYLLYVRFNKSKLRAIKKRYPVGSPGFEAYRVLYSTRTLVTSSFFSLLSIIYLLFNLYQSAHVQGSVWIALIVLGGFLLLESLRRLLLATNKKK